MERLRPTVGVGSSIASACRKLAGNIAELVAEKPKGLEFSWWEELPGTSPLIRDTKFKILGFIMATRGLL